MDSKAKKHINPKEIFQLISTILSWTLFVLLIICAAFLLYYFVATRLYATKGDKYEPKFSLYTIVSPSMVPNINVYDVIVNMRVDEPKDIKINDVITFTSSSSESSGMTITHRVISVIKDEAGNVSYQTKGDNNPVEDSGSVPFNSIIGRVGIRIPMLGRIQFFVASKMGWLFVIVLPALYIILKDLLKIFKLSKKKPNKRQGRISTLLHKPLYLPYKGRIIEENIKEVKPLINDETVDVDIDDLPELK
ncbi:MAG: signal peptidase I [Bacilli bacterium]